MKTITFLILLLSTSSFVTAQKNFVNVSANGLGRKSFLDFSYERETKKSFLISAGAQVGNFGKGNFESDKFKNGAYQGLPNSPYNNWISSQSDIGYTYRKKSYSTSNSGIAFNTGIGYRWKLNRKSSIDCQFLLSYYLVEDTHIQTYVNRFTNLPNITSTYKTKHQSFSHATRVNFNRQLNRNVSITAGAQIFFFVPINNEKYQNEYPINQMIGTEGNIFWDFDLKLPKL
jgi:hypothetical protein